MPNDPLTLYILSGFLAIIPAIIWLTIIFRKTKRRLLQVMIFLGSIFSVVPVFSLQYFMDKFPRLDVLKFLESNISDKNINLIFLFISVGIIEEIVKQGLIRIVDRKYLLIQTIGESIRFSLIGALGFSFAENIFYFYGIYVQNGIQQLFVAYLFRSIFTTLAHLVFSGLFGYYYGLAKFSINISEQSRWSGKKQRFTNWISKTMGMPNTQAFKEVTILKGLGLAIFLHALFDLLLQFNQIFPVAVYVVILGLILFKIISKKTAGLILVTDVDTAQTSTMARKDEEVVIELLGMWTNQKRYVDVIHICQRLLERDPDNKVVQLFKAQALDKISSDNVYDKILNKLFPTKTAKSIEEMAKSLTEKPTAFPKAATKPAENISSTTSQNPENDQTFKLNI